jgi:hypothetical protein
MAAQRCSLVLWFSSFVIGYSKCIGADKLGKEIISMDTLYILALESPQHQYLSAFTPQP